MESHKIIRVCKQNLFPTRREPLLTSQKSQWHSAFGTPPPSNISAPPSMAQPPYSPTVSVSSHDFSHINETLPQPAFSVTSNMTSRHMQAGTTYSPPTSYPTSYVSPTMWRESVASTYNTGSLKRRWTDDTPTAWIGSNDQQQVKRPR